MGDKAQPRGLDLAELAKRQHGVVSIRQLKARLGYSSGAVSKMVGRGVLHRLFRGVYAVGHTDLSPLGWCLGAVLTCGPGALLSHHSAAWLWGLSKSGPRPFHVTAPSPRAARTEPGRGRIALHRARGLTPADTAFEEQIPLTAVPRTLLDMAAVLPPRRLRRMLERAEELRLFDLEPVESVLARTKGHAGNGRLRRAIAIYQPPRFTRSTFEREFVAAVELAGLPRPRTGWVEGGYELDVYWPEHRFAVELDVFETHGTRAAFERDRVRDENLKLAGIDLIRVTAPRFEREPHHVIKRLSQLLRQRAGGSDPAVP